jgi:integrase
MKGSTFKRCTVCDRVVKGKRCTNCGSTSLSWGFVVDIGKDADGKRRQRRRTGFATERDADRALHELLASLGDGTAVAPSTVTVAEYLTGQWLPAVQPPNLRETTWVEYERITRLHVAPRIGGVPLQDLNASYLNRIYAELLAGGRADGAGGLSVKSVRNIHLMLGKALGDAVRWGLLRRNVAPLADPPPARVAAADRRERIRVWEVDQLATFLGHVRDDHLFALWFLLATTGMRRGEALGLRWADVDLGQARLSVRQALVSIDGTPKLQTVKSNHGVRTIDLDDDTVGVLRARRVAQAEERLAAGADWEDLGLVFTRDDGHWQNPDWVGEQFRRHVKTAGLPRIRPHDLRHSHATLLLKAGVNPKVVSERLGHHSVAFTLDTYAHVMPGMQRQAADAFAAMVRPKG